MTENKSVPSISYFPAQDLREKLLQTVCSEEEHISSSSGISPPVILNSFTSSPAATTPIVRADRPLHTSPFRSVQKPSIQLCGGSGAAPVSQWLEKTHCTTASDTHLVDYSTKIQMIWASEAGALFLDGIFVAVVITCGEM